MGNYFCIPDTIDNSNILTSTRSESREKTSFQQLLNTTSVKNADNAMNSDPIITSRFQSIPISSTEKLPAIASNFASKQEAIDRYRLMSDWEKYKDDQLLSNPGGDNYDLDKKEMINISAEKESFWSRVQKDLSDSYSNAKNFFFDFLFGSKMYYRGSDNQISETTKRGLIGSFLDFFKSFGSALSFGVWRPNGEEEPQGFFDRMIYSFSNVKKAIFGDIVEGVGNSVLNMGEDLALSLWNLVEAIPDATIGNLDLGKKITTTIFDNGQVLIDYLTDIMPTGEAWMRVHAFDITNLQNLELPIIYNIILPEAYSDDVRWNHIRNTPFRKAIETIGSLVADIVTVELLGDTKLFSEKANDRH